MTSINMGSTLKKSCNSLMRNVKRDRLSELPDEILVNILSFLPIIDAVRTVRIPRFGDLWTLVSSLVFKGIEIFKAENWPDAVIDSDEKIKRFSSFVSNVLMLHKGFPIDSFELNFLDLYNECDVDHRLLDRNVKLWIRFAIGREVKKLKIRFEFGVYDFDILPRCVFTSQFLVELKLEYCRIQLLSRVQMGSLRKLSLIKVWVCQEMFENIISGCPCLQELVMRNVHGVNKVRFTAPNIEKLDISSYDLSKLDCPNVKILNIPLSSRYGNYLDDLQQVNNTSVCKVRVRSAEKSDGVVNKICNVEVVKFSEIAFQELVLNELDIPQTRWKCLHIELRLNEDQLIGICRVLRSSPHLEELVIFSNSQSKTRDLHILSEELSFPCEVPQLKLVTLRGHKVPCQGLLRLVEILLRSCVNLEKMVILPSTYELLLVENLKFVEQICSFPRASTNARVICGSGI